MCCFRRQTRYSHFKHLKGFQFFITLSFHMFLWKYDRRNYFVGEETYT